MAIPTSQTTTQRSVQGYYTVGTGYTIPQTATSLTTANVPTDNSTVLIGIDVLTYMVPTAGTATYTFRNLPVRNTAANPLSPVAGQQSPLTVNTGDSLLFVAFAQGTQTPVAVETYGIISQVKRAPGPFLGPQTYSSFGVGVTGAAGSTGQVVGMLFLQRGSQT